MVMRRQDFDARRVQRNQRERNVSGHAEDDDFAQVQGRRSKQVDYVSSVSQTAGVELQHVSIFQVLEYAGQGQDSGIRVRTQISNLASDLEVKQISLELKVRRSAFDPAHGCASIADECARGLKIDHLGRNRAAS